VIVCVLCCLILLVPRLSISVVLRWLFVPLVSGSSPGVLDDNNVLPSFLSSRGKHADSLNYTLTLVVI
jgi:hypothetical protein